jgi:hypothetical protein
MIASTADPAVKKALSQPNRGKWLASLIELAPSVKRAAIML